MCMGYCRKRYSAICSCVLDRASAQAKSCSLFCAACGPAVFPKLKTLHTLEKVTKTLHTLEKVTNVLDFLSSLLWRKSPGKLHDFWNCALFSGCSTNSLMSSQAQVPPGAGKWKWAWWTLMNVNEDFWATLFLRRSPCSVSSCGSWVADWRGPHAAPAAPSARVGLSAVIPAAVGPSVSKSMFFLLLTPAQSYELVLLACVFSPHTVQE